LKAEVKSPVTVRRQFVILGDITPKRLSMRRMSEVWSKTWEFTQPPLLQGEMTTIGTRTPRPYGPGVLLVAGYDGLPLNSSLVVPAVEIPSARDCGGVGGTIWSKKPSFSSNMYKKMVLLQTSGLAVNASSMLETYQAPKLAGQLPCSL